MYFVNEREIISNYNYLKEKIEVDRLFYALKPNSDVNVISSLCKCNAGFEIWSCDELNKIIDCKVSADKIISSIPVPSDKFIISAYNYGVRYFTFDCLWQLNKLITLAKDSKKIMRIFISDIDSESHKWGMSLEEMCDDDFTKKLDYIDGVSIHISRNYQKNLLYKIFERIEKALSKLNTNKKIIVNIGGGCFRKLPKHLSYKYDLEQFYSELNNYLNKIRQKYNNIVLYGEPGRGIVDSSCDLVAKIEMVSIRRGKKYLFMDTQTYRFGSLPNQVRKIHKDGKESLIYDNDWILDRKKTKNYSRYTIVSLSCEWIELFGFIANEELETNDILKFCGVGAYTYAASITCSENIPSIKINEVN